MDGGTNGGKAYLSLFLLLTANPALAEHPLQGEAIAKRWCSECHVVSSEQRQARSDAPSFRSIARRPEFSSRVLAYWLLAPHPPMPDFSLTRTEADSLAHYIASLK